MKHFETHLLLEYAQRRMQEEARKVRLENMVVEARALQTDQAQSLTARMSNWLSVQTNRLRKQVDLPQTNLEAECSTCP